MLNTADIRARSTAPAASSASPDELSADLLYGPITSTVFSENQKYVSAEDLVSIHTEFVSLIVGCLGVI